MTDDGEYHVVRCAPKGTLDVLSRLKGACVTTPVCPTYDAVERKGRQRQRVTVTRPVLPGFVFVRTVEARRVVEALYNGGLTSVRLMRHPGAASHARVAAKELVPLMVFAEQHAAGRKRTVPKDIVPGVTARVTDGPFKDMTGVVTAVGDGRAHVLLGTAQLGVTLPALFLRKAVA